MSAYLELTIIEKAFKALSNRGYSFAVSYERGYDTDEMEWTKTSDTGLRRLRACDEEWIMISTDGEYPDEDDPQGDAWIHVIYGNGDDGLDVISDYTTNLEDVLKPVFDWIRTVEEINTGSHLLQMRALGKI
jgi:hypothetical protein